METRDGHFDRLFIAPGPTIEAFHGCRSFTALDETFWKTQWNLTLLLAVAMDGNDEILPLAWGVAGSESKNSWSFFCQHLKRAFPSIDEKSMVVISDRGKGLEAAVPEELPNAHHLHCCQHLCENIMAMHPGDTVQKLFWKAAQTPSQKEFTSILKEIENIRSDVATYLSKIPPTTWAKWAIPVSQYDHLTSNIVESVNSSWMKIQEMPILEALHAIWYVMMEKFSSR